MALLRGSIYLADLSHKGGTEPGKARPVLVVQTDLLNQTGHPSTIVLPLTSRIVDDAEPLRVRVPDGLGLEAPSDILIDQLRAVDNSRMLRLVATLSSDTLKTVELCLTVVLDI
jgi:mRNA interferase MazF